MAVGIPQSASSINNLGGSLAVQLRYLCYQIAVYQDNLTTLGTAGLEQIGFSPDDAAAIQSLGSILNTIAQVYYGNATQATQYNFQTALAPLCGGQ